jgi:hypothetical protein
MAERTATITANYRPARRGLAASPIAEQLLVRVEQNGAWYNVIVNEVAAIESGSRNVAGTSYGYNWREKRWSYDQTPPAEILAAFKTLRAEFQAAAKAAKK